MILITSKSAISPAILVALFCFSVKYAGTVITTDLICLFKNDSALLFNFDNI